MAMKPRKPRKATETTIDSVPFDAASNMIALTGRVIPDANFTGRLLVHRTNGRIASIHQSQIAARAPLVDDLETVFVPSGIELWNIERVYAEGGEPWRPLAQDEMENIAPPKPKSIQGMPKRSTKRQQEQLLEALAITKSIAGAAAAYNGSCAGSDRYNNNCAHFLSDAFIRAGYSELSPPSNCIHARCSTSSKRPIRARNMWCWFRNMATKSKRELIQNTGFWAVFQLDESAYWGGHVCIVDTDNWVHYGTGFYPDWDQYAYQW